MVLTIKKGIKQLLKRSRTYTKITRSKILIQYWQNLFQTETFQSGNFLKSSLAQKFPEIIFRLNLRDNISIWTNLNTCGPTLIRNLSETSKLFICSPIFAIIPTSIFWGKTSGKRCKRLCCKSLKKVDAYLNNYLSRCSSITVV